MHPKGRGKWVRSYNAKPNTGSLPVSSYAGESIWLGSEESLHHRVPLPFPLCHDRQVRVKLAERSLNLVGFDGVAYHVS